MTRRTTSSAGFTLIEALVVMAIMAAVITSVFTARPKFATARLNTEARSITATLLAARSRAQAGNSDVVVAVDTERRRIGSGGAMRQLPDGMDVLLTVAESERRGGTGGVRFYPDGTSSGGELLISYQGRNKHVVVNWFTGAPRIE